MWSRCFVSPTISYLLLQSEAVITTYSPLCPPLSILFNTTLLNVLHIGDYYGDFPLLPVCCLNPLVSRSRHCVLSAPPLSEVLSDVMGVEAFFSARTNSDRSALLWDITTVPSCLPRYHLFSRELKFLEPQFFFHRLTLTVNPSPWKSVWCVVDGDNGKIIFYFYSGNCLVRWIVGSRGETLGYPW